MTLLSALMPSLGKADVIPPEIARAVNHALALPALIAPEILGSPRGCGGDSPAPAPEHSLVLTFRLANDQGASDLLPTESWEGRSDDLGHTHGYGATLEVRLADGSRFTVILSNDLFSARTDDDSRVDAEGVRFVQQHFTEEQKLLLRWDNRLAGRTLYVSAAAGAHFLDSTPTDLPTSSAAQQTVWHHWVNENTPARFAERVQVADERGLRVGALGEARLGVQPRLLRARGRAGDLEIRVYAETGVELSTQAGASQWISDGGVRLESAGPRLPFVGRPRITGEAGATSRVHAEGVVVEPHTEVTLGTDLLELGATWRGYEGPLPNHVLYNLPGLNQPDGGNDSLSGFFVRTRF
ncbi:MAG: hypothetical protein IT285_06815 [Bdellovibrionales bacterium]|nr:hypothetical protein [Bdellovibrionales bacterium]